MDVVNVDRKKYPPKGEDVEAFGPSADSLVAVSI